MAVFPDPYRQSTDPPANRGVTDPCPKTDFGSHDENQTVLATQTHTHTQAGGVATPASVIRDGPFKEDEEGQGLFFISMVSPSLTCFVHNRAEQYRSNYI